MNPDALLGRVRKLLAMAEAEGLPDAARESYNAKAAELIAQYGIDRALIEDGSPTGPAAGDVVMGIDAPYARDKISLLASVADPLGCRLVHRTAPSPAGSGGATLHSAHLFGMAVDIERVQMIYTSLLVQQAHGLAAARPPAWEDPRAFRRSWMAGFAVAVRDRLAQAEEAARRRAEESRARSCWLVGRAWSRHISPASIRVCARPERGSSPDPAVGTAIRPASGQTSGRAGGCRRSGGRGGRSVDRMTGPCADPPEG